MKITFQPSQLREPYKVLTDSASELSSMNVKNLRVHSSNKPVVFRAGDEIKILNLDTIEDEENLPERVYYKGPELLISEARKLFFLGCADQNQRDLKTIFANLSAVGRYMYDLHHGEPVNKDPYQGFSEGIIFESENEKLHVIPFESAKK